jgi:hypothetical protein
METDPGAFDLMLEGCYAQFKGMADDIHRLGEYPGDNLLKDKSSTDSFMQYIDYLHNPNNAGRANNIMNSCYKMIIQASDLIRMAGENPTDAAIAHKAGEAYYLRGLSYFYLSRVFGRPYYQSPETSLAVPIINEQPEDILAAGNTIPPRATVAQTYQQAIDDLKSAETLMTTSNADIVRTKGNIYATKEAAQAMLSTVYLYMSGTYENPNTQYADLSIEYANKVISSGRFAMSSSDEMRLDVAVGNRTPENNAEVIYAVKRTHTDAQADYGRNIGSLYTVSGGSGWGEIYASEKYLDRLRHSGGDDLNVFGPNAADVRGSFIAANYATGANAIDVFRVVVDTYGEDGTLTNFVYLQLPVTGTPGSYVATQGDVQYPLTQVGDRYTFDFTPANGPKTTYTGDIDKQMNNNVGFPRFYIWKCSVEGGPANRQLWSPVISRLAEMYLNIAESYVKKGDFANALTAINVVRDRAVEGNSITLDQITANGPEVVDNERALELAFEAHRAYDVYRIGHDMERRYPAFLRNDAKGNNNLKNIPADHSVVVQVFSTTTINAFAQYGKLEQNPVDDLPDPEYTPYTPFVPYE